MRNALLALHFQNDTCHEDGKVPFSRERGGRDLGAFLARCRGVLERARAQSWLVVHVHIGFADDYADLPRNCRLFRAVAEAGAVRRGSWGAAPVEGFEPAPGEAHLIRGANNAFLHTDLDARLREAQIERLYVMGLATQFSVEHTVRHASDLGYLVTVIADCCGSASAEMHAASLHTMAYLADIANAAGIA